MAASSMNKRSRILMVISQLGYGGAEGSFLRLAGFLSRYFDVTIALMARDYGSSDYSAAQSETTLPMVMLDGGRHKRSGLLAKALRWWQMVRRLRKLKYECDVTISFMSGPNLLNALAGCSTTTILSERGSKRFDTGMSPRLRWIWTRVLDPLAYRGARFVVTASQGIAEEIGKANPSIASSVRAIEGTVQTLHLLELAEAPCEPEFEVFRKFQTIVSFGRMHHQKGFDALLQIFARVRAQCPAARLLLIGDGPQITEYRTLAQTLGLRTSDVIDPDKFDVVFAGYRPNPLRYLKLGRVFALTSRSEGLPNALIEALATGVPILAADCPWGPRSILAGQGDAAALRGGALPLTLEHGTLMPLPDTPEGAAAWEAALAETLVQPARRRSPEACRNAVARFDIEATGPRWVELICALASPTTNAKAPNILGEGPSA